MNHRHGTRPTLSYDIPTHPGLIIRHLPGGRHRAQRTTRSAPLVLGLLLTAPFHLSPSVAMATQNPPKEPAHVVSQPDFSRPPDASGQLATRSGTSRSTRSDVGGGPAVDDRQHTVNSGGRGVMDLSHALVLRTVISLEKCSQCGREPVVEQGVDKDDDQVGLCEQCSQAADGKSR